MKEYVKPTLEVVELRLEERVANCQNMNNGVGNDNGYTSGKEGNCQSKS